MARLCRWSPENMNSQASPRERAQRKEPLGEPPLGASLARLQVAAKGAAIGAGTGAGVGAGSEVITKGDQVKIPSETLLEFTLQQSATIPKQAA
jgi:hypothetical protein